MKSPKMKEFKDDCLNRIAQMKVPRQPDLGIPISAEFYEYRKVCLDEWGNIFEGPKDSNWGHIYDMMKPYPKSQKL